MNFFEDSIKVTAKKPKKYPDVSCPHFKNGGQCKNCISAWKNSQ